MITLMSHTNNPDFIKVGSIKESLPMLIKYNVFLFSLSSRNQNYVHFSFVVRAL